MSNLENNIEQYLLEELPEADIIAFEKAIEKDPKLAESVAEHRKIMERLEALRLRNKVKKVLETPDPESLNGISFRSRRFLGLLFLGLLSLAGAWWLFQYYFGPSATVPSAAPAQAIEKARTLEPIEPQKMAQEVPPPAQVHPSKPSKTIPQTARLIALAGDYHLGPNQSVIREALESKTVGSKTALQVAIAQYELGNYRQSADLLKSENAVATDGAARFLRASARFQLGQYNSAAADFEVLHSSFMLQYEGRWNYMLCQLALGEREKAQGLLSAMAADLDFPFRARALELQEKLLSDGL